MELSKQTVAMEIKLIIVFYKWTIKQKQTSNRIN